MSLNLANITIATSDGPSTFYSRSRSSIHQHAMNVSLQNAGKRSRSGDKHQLQSAGTPQPRTEFMTRFRLKERPTRKRSKAADSRRKKVNERAADDREDAEVLGLSPARLPRHIPYQPFPFETGLAGPYLQSILGQSLFGQVPHIFNPEYSHLDYALHDDALRTGLLALACLGRDLDQDMKASTLCLKLKGHTIRAIRRRLSGDISDLTVETIGAIAALAAFDLLECLGKPEPRPDSMSFLHLAITRKGGLNGLSKEITDSCGQCYMLKRIVLWLDLSFAIMDETPTQFAFHNAPIHLASTALHTVSLHMTPLRVVFAELSELSRSADEVDLAPSSVQRIALGDSVAGLEQYALTLDAPEIEPPVLEMLRLSTFLYSARYIRRFSSNSRVQMGLAIRLQKCFSTYLTDGRHTMQGELGSQLERASTNSVEEAILVWAATIAAASSGSFKEISGHDHLKRREFWSQQIVSLLRNLGITSTTEVEMLLHNLTRDTNRCQEDRRLLLEVCGVPDTT